MFRKRHPNIGSRPGTLVIAKDSPPPTIRVIRYQREGSTDETVEDWSKVKGMIDSDHVTWIDICGFGDQSVLRNLSTEFQIHPLALESIVNVPQRPKIEVYDDDHVLVIMRMIKLDDANEIDIEQISVLLGRSYVITFQERSGDVMDPVRKRIRSGNTIRKYGADFLAYAIIDAIVDGYYPVLEQMGDYIEPIEDTVISNPTPELLGELHHMKNQLVNLRRAIWPQREAIQSMIHDNHPLIGDGIRLYLRDTQDHCAQTSEVIEMYREIISSLLNMYLSSVANRTNEIMKVLTIVSTVFIPLTFLAGIYGMNFEHMPELKFQMAYPVFWSVILLVGLGLFVFFWRTGWLGSSDTRPRMIRSEDHP